MNKKLPFYIVLLLIATHINAELSRFKRIIKLYNNYRYSYENRNILLSFSYLKREYIDNIDSLLMDTTIFSGSKLEGAIELFYWENSEDFSNDKGKSITTSFKNTYSLKEYFQDNNGSAGSYDEILDTAEVLLKIAGAHSFYSRKFFDRYKKKFRPFMQINTDVWGDLFYSKELNYDFYDQDIEDEWKDDRFIKRVQQASVTADISLKGGVGKQLNATPLYQALWIEKKLRKYNVIDFTLSEKTIASIAKLLAQNNTYKIGKYKKSKELKAQIDTILAKDAAVDPKKLRYISPLEINKTFLCNAPVLKYKPQLRLLTTARLKTELSRTEIDFPYDVFNKYDDTTYIKFNPIYDHLLALYSSLGIPFTKYWFFSIRAQRNLISTDKETDFYDHKKRIKWDEVLDTRLEIQTMFWLTEWFIIKLGLNDFPTWLLIPREQPYKYYMNMDIFIENYLILTIALSYYNSKDIYNSYIKWVEASKGPNEGIKFTISAIYNF